MADAISDEPQRQKAKTLRLLRIMLRVGRSERTLGGYVVYS